MRLTGPRGFSLAELLAGLVLAGTLGTILARAVLSTSRVFRAHQERAMVETAFDLAAEYLGTELAAIGRGDLLRAAPESLSFRAVRLVGIACLVTTTEVRILEERLSAARSPQAGRDSIQLYLGADSISGLDGWAGLPIHAVGRQSCGTRPALRLSTSVDSGTLAAARSSDLVPVRTFEIMQARFYQSLDATWLGARSESAGEAVQPLAGPFDRSGTGFEFVDSTGLITHSPASVRTIRVSFSGTSSGWNGAAGTYTARVTRSVSPRNLRP